MMATKTPAMTDPAPLLTAPRVSSMIIHEYRHDCSERNHQLLVRVTLDGFELICPRCRVENQEHARVTITWTEILTLFLLALRTRA